MTRDAVVGDPMAFSRENEEWVKTEINKAIKAAIYPPGRAAKLLHSLRNWGLIASLVTIPLGLFAVVVTLGIRIVSDIREEATFRKGTEDRLTAIEKSLLTLQVSSAAIGPKRQTNQTEAINALKRARKLDSPLSAGLIRDAGTSFISAAESDPAAWDVALDFAAYRTSLNDNLVPRVQI